MEGALAVDWVRQEPTPDEESGWVKASIDGDRQAFERLYRAHCDRIHGLMWRLSGGQSAVAEDLVQEAFIRAWQKLDQFRGDARFGTWLHRLAVNVALSDRRIRLRQAERERPMDDGTERAAIGASDVPAGLQRDLEQAIAKLPERARTVLVLYDIEGYPHKDIARMTGMAVGSSKAQLHRARALVRETLSQ